MLSATWAAPGARPGAVLFEDLVAVPDSNPPREAIAEAHRMRTSEEFAEIKRDGIALRERNFVLLTLAVPGRVSKVGFIASKKSVGGAVQRNRARRRLREIVRRRWNMLPHGGHWLLFIASRRTVTAPHAELLHDVDHALEAAVHRDTTTS